MNRTIKPAANRLFFFDMVRNVAMLSVIAYHAVAAYSTVTPHWGFHNGDFFAADVVRHLFDVFQMPAFFFVAGYFALPSLRREGGWGFIKEKMRRIGAPWVLGVFLVLPMLRHTNPETGPHPAFLTEWLSYLEGFGTFETGLYTAGGSQAHFWFLSLLLFFFVTVGLYYGMRNRRQTFVDGCRVKRAASRRSILTALLAAGISTSLVYFVVVLLLPEALWASINLVLVFQPTSLVVYVAAFALGIFAASRQWFAGDAFPGTLKAWIVATALLVVGFFVVGREVFSHPSTSQQLPPLLLLAFSLIRTFLCLAFLVLIIVCSRRYWDRPSRPIQSLSANSYNIYLVHFFFVLFFQIGLASWREGPPAAKAAIVFFATLPFSYGLSRVIDRFPRGFVLFLFALFAFFCVGRYIGL